MIFESVLYDQCGVGLLGMTEVHVLELIIAGRERGLEFLTSVTLPNGQITGMFFAILGSVIFGSDYYPSCVGLVSVTELVELGPDCRKKERERVGGLSVKLQMDR